MKKENESFQISNEKMNVILEWFNDKKVGFTKYNNQIINTEYSVKFIFEQLNIEKYTPNAYGFIEIGEYKTHFRIFEGEFEFDAMTIHLKNSYLLAHSLELINILL